MHASIFLTVSSNAWSVPYRLVLLPPAAGGLAQLAQLQALEASAHALDLPGGCCVLPQGIPELELQLHAVHVMWVL